MGSHDNCGDWEYETHPDQSGLKRRCERLIKWMLRWPRRFNRYGFDTRPGHAFMFAGMAPQDCTCILGTYRGDQQCQALTNYLVQVPADSRVGFRPDLVTNAIKALEGQLHQVFQNFEAWLAGKYPDVPEDVVLTRLVDIVCTALEMFLRIHPYANGNGHAARLLVWVLLTRHGFPPESWPLDESVAYSKALTEYRNANRRPLNVLVLRSIGKQAWET